MLDAFFPKKYPETRLWRSLLGLDGKYEFSRKSFSTTLSRLRRQGFVERKNAKRNAIWKITVAGKKRLHRMYKEQRIPYAHLYPPQKPDTSIRIVTFDIPERMRKKRDWLRLCLSACGFTMLQKSVWVGNRPLPRQLIAECKNQEILDYIHIFGVSQKGTLEES